MRIIKYFWFNYLKSLKRGKPSLRAFEQLYLIVGLEIFSWLTKGRSLDEK